MSSDVDRALSEYVEVSLYMAMLNAGRRPTASNERLAALLTKTVRELLTDEIVVESLRRIDAEVQG